MTSHDWNPLSYFREMGTLSKVLLLLGFAFLGAGLAHDASLRNPTVIFALALVSFSLTSHYFSASLPLLSDPPYKRFIDWPKMLSGVAMSLVTLFLIISLYFAPPKPAPYVSSTQTSPSNLPQTCGATDQHAIKSQEVKPELPQTNNRSKVKGNKVSAKTVTGDNGALVERLNQGPGSIAQIGGQGNQATVNNFGKQSKPDRKIRIEDRDTLVAYLARYPAKARVAAVQGDREAYIFAKDWYDVLKTAKWDMPDSQVRVFIVGGEPWIGVQMHFYGEPVTPGEKFQVPIESPGGHIYQAFEAEQVEAVTGDRDPKMDKDLVVINVGPKE